MKRRPWMLIALAALFSLTIAAKDTPNHTREDCVEVCVKKAMPCYEKCDATQKECEKKAKAKCKADKDCLADELRECKDEREIHCDPQCSITVLQCINKCPSEVPPRP